MEIACSEAMSTCSVEQLATFDLPSILLEERRESLSLVMLNNFRIVHNLKKRISLELFFFLLLSFDFILPLLFLFLIALSLFL